MLATDFSDASRAAIGYAAAIAMGYLGQAIQQCAESYKADLIVMGVRGAGSMVRAATHFGSTAYRVISQARAPVLSVRQFHQDISRTN